MMNVTGCCQGVPPVPGGVGVGVVPPPGGVGAGVVPPPVAGISSVLPDLVPQTLHSSTLRPGVVFVASVSVLQ